MREMKVGYRVPKPPVSDLSQDELLAMLHLSTMWELKEVENL